ncbi:MAG: aminoacyl-histidine dipeptidase [Oscillospiraceae bacterium]|nr:aminoacyl-histidine dipeptidase [Oscillospiraceae bacterium]
MQITELEPKKVFHYFSELAKIPHGSGNTRQIEQYCLDFAEKRGLRAYRDEYGNVMIFKDGTEGYEQSAPVILQGHLDMVCEKLPDCTKDMEREGIDIIVDQDFLRADGTTLGGDDSIAVAYILALLDSDDIEHPPIEGLLTIDEETGLRGANALDATQLRGRRLINIDSEEESVITVSCAGAARISCEIPVDTVTSDGIAKEINIGGFWGGHSGIDINKNRKNAIKVLGELLYELSSGVHIHIASIFAGGRLNVITPSAKALVCIDRSEEKEFDRIVEEFDDRLKKECVNTEPDAYVSAQAVSLPEKYADLSGTGKIIFALMQSPSGVRAVNPDMPDLTQTSSNPGEAIFDDSVLKLNFMIRSNSDADKLSLVKTVKSFVEYAGGTVELGDNYPAWEYRSDSPLRDTMAAVYEEMYGEKPVITSLHAGLECGILTEKLPGADMVSIGPTMWDVHTPEERLDIKSCERVWKYLLRVLKMLK